MAQWIPKTAWKVANLNKRYGTPYMTKGYAALDSQCSLDAYASLQHDVSAQAIRSAIAAVGGPDAGAVVIDVRSDAERRRQPIVASAVVALHPHDILSGAAAPVLPSNNSKAELFVLSSESQRAVNTCVALRRWGYTNVSAVSPSVVAEALAETQASKNGHGEGAN
jgi:rhodanese-related sulfurtransferase